MADDSDSLSEEERPPKKRRRQPDPVEIVEVDEEESEGVIEVVEEGSGGEENEDEVEDKVDDDNEDGLQEQHQADIPAYGKTKKDTTKDLRTVFSDRTPVTFKLKGGEMETLVGRWCNICRLVRSSCIIFD